MAAAEAITAATAPAPGPVVAAANPMSSVLSITAPLAAEATVLSDVQEDHPVVSQPMAATVTTSGATTTAVAAAGDDNFQERRGPPDGGPPDGPPDGPPLPLPGPGGNNGNGNGNGNGSGNRNRNSNTVSLHPLFPVSLPCVLVCLTQTLSHCALSLDAMASTKLSILSLCVSVLLLIHDVQHQGMLDAPCKQCADYAVWHSLNGIAHAGLLRQYIALYWHIIYHRRITNSHQRCSGTGSGRCADCRGAVCLFCESLLSISCLACALSSSMQKHSRIANGDMRPLKTS